MKTVIIILVISAVILYVPVGIAASKGMETENIEISVVQNGISVKIAHISDLHYPANGVELSKIKQETEDARPDLVFLTGDILDSSATNDDINDLEEFLSDIGKIGKAFTVLGNHEIALNNLKPYKTILDRCDITILEDAAVQTEVKGQKIIIAGIVDNHNYGQNGMDFEGLDQGIPIFLLAHRPEKWESYLLSTNDRKPLIAFSGHAHGGQIRLFGKGVLSHGSGMFPKYTDGVYTNNGSYMVVSRGLGDSDFPLRVYNKYHLPIITVILG